MSPVTLRVASENGPVVPENGCARTPNSETVNLPVLRVGVRVQGCGQFCVEGGGLGVPDRGLRVGGWVEGWGLEVPLGDFS